MKRTYFVLKFILFVLFLSVSHQEAGALTDPKKTNWYNTYYNYGDDPTDGCLGLLFDNTIIFEFKVRFIDPNHQNYPRLQVYFSDINSGNSGIIDLYSVGTLHAITLENGTPAYELVTTISMVASSYCDVARYCHEMQYQIVTDQDPKNPGMTVAYPLYDNPGLFPPTIFDDHGNRGRSNYWVKRKEVCCHFAPILPPNPEPCGGLENTEVIDNSLSPFIPAVWVAGNRNPVKSTIQSVDGKTPIQSQLSSPSISEDASFSVSPNPFNERLSLKLHGIEINPKTIRCLNLQGSNVPIALQDAEIEANEKSININTSDWPSGIYVLQFYDTNNVSHSTRLIKI